MVPAILVNNRIVTGGNHGEAFSKLTATEKDSDLQSGFIDYENLKFVSDETVIYLKEIILLRHAHSESQGNSPITDLGEDQAVNAGKFLATLNLEGFIGFCSPYLRCLQTSAILKEQCQVGFEEDCRLARQEECDMAFNERILATLDTLPRRSILVTHTDFIQNLLVLTQLMKERLQYVQNCSITYINQNRLIWVAKTT